MTREVFSRTMRGNPEGIAQSIAVNEVNSNNGKKRMEKLKKVLAFSGE